LPVIQEGGFSVIFEKIKNILAQQLDLDESKITMDSLIIDDLGADSLEIVDLAMEDEFDLQISDEAIEGVKTVGDIVRLIEESVA
jgi:acyl carrier protein